MRLTAVSYSSVYIILPIRLTNRSCLGITFTDYSRAMQTRPAYNVIYYKFCGLQHRQLCVKSSRPMYKRCMEGARYSVYATDIMHMILYQQIANESLNYTCQTPRK
jgi:hypothetical protein